MVNCHQFCLVVEKLVLDLLFDLTVDVGLVRVHGVSP